MQEHGAIRKGPRSSDMSDALNSEAASEAREGNERRAIRGLTSAPFARSRTILLQLSRGSRISSQGSQDIYRTISPALIPLSSSCILGQRRSTFANRR